MSKHQHKLVRSLTGEFIGWGDDRTPHRYIKLATVSGDRIVKIAKSLRSQIQDWQPGIWVFLLCQERGNPTTGIVKIKAKQLLTTPVINLSEEGRELAKIAQNKSVTTSVEPPTQIQICQGSSCRSRGSAGICQSIQTYLEAHDLTDRVEIKPVKCLHQCKAAPHAILNSSIGGISDKTHYRQLQHYQIKAILTKHFPTDIATKSIGTNLIEQISNYLQQRTSSTSNKSLNFNSQSCKI
jgi:hypothetical protein